MQGIATSGAISGTPAYRKDPKLIIQHTRRLVITALIVAWSFDYLFWNKNPGISFLLFTLLILFGAIYLTAAEAQRPARNALLILPLTIGFAWMTFVRLEPMTVFLDVLIVLGSMAVLAVTWLGGKWPRYRFPDYLLQFLRLVAGIIVKPWQLFMGSEEGSGEIQSSLHSTPGKLEFYRPFLSIILGLIIAFPILVLLASLLSSADQIFAARYKDLLAILRLDNIPEYIFRTILILILALLLSGAYAHSLLSSRDEKLIDPQNKIIPAFFGWLEASTILLCVNLLFTFFVAIQFRYFFGGQGNVSQQGFTYAEYARRGFGELVVVATLSMLLFLSLSTITRRGPGAPRWIFTGMGIGLLLMVAVILASAFQRLNLYESVYGFTRLRIYTHTFMIWLGLLLMATVGLEVTDRLRHFALACVLVWFGFGASLNALNVDALIVARNVKRAQMGFELDAAYLANLSPDAIPELFKHFEDPDLPQSLREDIGAALVCRSALVQQSDRSLPWQSFHLSRARAQSLTTASSSALDGYSIVKNNGEVAVSVNERTVRCTTSRGWD